jgi:hypothetical protein
VHDHSFPEKLTFPDKLKLLSSKFGERLIFMWPFGETNAAAIGTLKTRAGSGRAQWQCLAGHERGRQLRPLI